MAFYLAFFLFASLLVCVGEQIPRSTGDSADTGAFCGYNAAASVLLRFGRDPASNRTLEAISTKREISFDRIREVFEADNLDVSCYTVTTDPSGALLRKLEQVKSGTANAILFLPEGVFTGVRDHFFVVDEWTNEYVSLHDPVSNFRVDLSRARITQGVSDSYVMVVVLPVSLRTKLLGVSARFSTGVLVSCLAVQVSLVLFFLYRYKLESSDGATADNSKVSS